MGKNVNIRLGANITDFQSKMRKAQKSFKRTAANFKKIGKSMTMSLTLPLTAFAAASVKAFDTQAKAIAQVEQGLKTTGGLVGRTSKQLQKMATDLQAKTLFGDEVILKDATAQLLTFTNITGKQFDRTQVAALDLATRLDGDLKSASIQLGKALNDPIANLSALSRSGIQFSTDQKKVIKSLAETGRLADAQTIILDELEKQYGGSAEAAAKAGAGGLKQLQNRFSDLMEKIGKMLIPVLNKLIKWLDKGITKWNNLDSGLKGAIITIGLVVAAIGPLLTIVGTLGTAFLTLLSPIGAVLGLAAALGAGINFLSVNWNNFIITVAKSSKPVKNLVTGLMTAIGKALGPGLGTTLQTAAMGIDKLAEAIDSGDLEPPDVNWVSFGDSISMAADQAKKSFANLGKFLGVDAEVDGSVLIAGVSLIEIDTEEMEEEAEDIDTTYGDSIVALREKMTALKDATTQFGLAMVKDFAGSLSQAVVSGENFFKAMGRIFVDIAKQIAAMIIQAAILAAIFAMIPGLGAAQAAAGGATSFSGLLTGSLTGRASGGSVIGGQPYMVGEGGPELFMPGQSGTIIPNNNLGGGSLSGQFSVSGSDLILTIDNQIAEDTNGLGASLVNTTIG